MATIYRSDQETLQRLVSHFASQATRGNYPNYKGEYHSLCPFHNDSKLGSFSFSERGFFCFSCGAKGSLRLLAQQVGIDDGPIIPVQALRKLADGPARPTMDKPLSYLDQFRPLPPDAIAYARRRGLSDSSIDDYRIGYGLLPHSRAEWPRLIIPVIEGGRVVGLRARAMDSRDSAPKWLQSAGSKTTLFNRELVTPGRDLIVTEAPLSAILAMQLDRSVVAVASTCGAATWRDEWADEIKARRPARVKVWMDNDAAGRSSSVKVANSLLGRGLSVRIHQWTAGTPEKYDLADYCLSNNAA